MTRTGDARSSNEGAARRRKEAKWGIDLLRTALGAPAAPRFCGLCRRFRNAARNAGAIRKFALTLTHRWRKRDSNPRSPRISSVVAPHAREAMRRDRACKFRCGGVRRDNQGERRFPIQIVALQVLTKRPFRTTQEWRALHSATSSSEAVSVGRSIQHLVPTTSMRAPSTSLWSRRLRSHNRAQLFDRL